MSDEETEPEVVVDPRVRAELELLERVKAIGAAAIAVLGVCAMLGAFASWTLAHGETRTNEQIAPLDKRVGILEAQVPFILVETREVRVEQRALAAKGVNAPELARPLLPLPGLDGGLP